MSSYKKTSAKPYCKVCYDAGKPENVYTSHFVKDKQGPEGKVACPYLLSLTCTYCKKKEGHTAKHCPNLLAKQPQVQAKQQTQVQAKQIQTQAQAKQQEQLSQAKPTLHEHDDGWSRVGKKTLVVVLAKKEEPEKKVVVATSKKVSLMAAFIEEDEKKDEEKENSRILEERKRIQFESEFPSLPVTKKVKLSPPEKVENKAPEKVENKAPETAVFEYNFSGGSWADYDD